MLGKIIKAIAEYNGNPIPHRLIKKHVEYFTIRTLFRIFHKSISYACDITNEESLKEVKEDLINKKIPIYGLINNAARNPKS